MKMTEKLGITSGALATLSLGHINLIFGVLASLFTIACLLPQAITAWRNLIYDYRVFLKDLGLTGGFVSFLQFVLVRGKKQPAETRLNKD